MMIILTTRWPFGMTDSEAAILIPTIVSILVFALGILVKWIYDHRHKRRSIIAYRNVVFEWTKLIINTILAQSQSLRDFSSKLSTTHSLLPERYAFSRSMSDKLRDLSAEKVVSVFIINCRCNKNAEDKRAKYSFNLVSQYDFLASVESIVKENYESYNRQANDLREKWNTLLQNIQHEMDAIKPETTRDFQALETIRGVIMGFMKRKVQSDLIEEIYPILIVPLNETVDACKGAFPEVRCCQTVYECARKMIILYNSWYALKTGYSEVFNTYAASIDKSVSALRQAIEYYKESTRVACWVK